MAFSTVVPQVAAKCIFIQTRSCDGFAAVLCLCFFKYAKAPNPPRKIKCCNFNGQIEGGKKNVFQLQRLLDLL